MNNKGFSSILIIVVILAMVALGFVVYKSQGKQPSQIVSSSSEPVVESEKDYGDWLGYFNYDRNFRIRYPEDWVKDELQNNTTVVKFSKNNIWEVFVNSFLINDMQDPTLEDLFEANVETATKFPDYKEVSTGDASLGGLPAKEIVLTATFEKKVKSKTVLAVKSQRLYSVNYRAAPDKYDEMLSTVDKMIESFELVK